MLDKDYPNQYLSYFYITTRHCGTSNEYPQQVLKKKNYVDFSVSKNVPNLEIIIMQNRGPWQVGLERHRYAAYSDFPVLPVDFDLTTMWRSWGWNLQSLDL